MNFHTNGKPVCCGWILIKVSVWTVGRLFIDTLRQFSLLPRGDALQKLSVGEL